MQQNINRVIDLENKQVVAQGKKGRERNKWGRLIGTNFQLQKK